MVIGYESTYIANQLAVDRGVLLSISNLHVIAMPQLRPARLSKLNAYCNQILHTSITLKHFGEQGNMLWERAACLKPYKFINTLTGTWEMLCEFSNVIATPKLNIERAS